MTRDDRLAVIMWLLVFLTPIIVAIDVNLSLIELTLRGAR